MTVRRWFLPETPDVLGLLSRQAGITLEAADAFAAWAAGDDRAAQRVRDAEQAGDTVKRELLEALRDAFVTPVEPEDLFTLSRQLDWILDHVRDVITEAGVMGAAPDEGLAAMAGHLAEAMRHIDQAISRMRAHQDPTEQADAAIRAEHKLRQTYYEGMGTLLEVQHMRERVSSRELYRRCAQIGEAVIDVSDRIVYALVKEG